MHGTFITLHTPVACRRNRNRGSRRYKQRGKACTKVIKKELNKILSYIEEQKPEVAGDQMREVVEREMPDLLPELPPKPKVPTH
jgi:hypothetical protein